MNSGKGMFCLNNLCWGLLLFNVIRIRGVFGLVYLLLCNIALCVHTSSPMALIGMWGVWGYNCRIVFCGSLCDMTVFAPSLLYLPCHFNADYVMFSCWRFSSWFFLLHYYWNYGLLILLHTVCFVVLWTLNYRSTSEFYFCFLYLAYSFSLHWPIKVYGLDFLLLDWYLIPLLCSRVWNIVFHPACSSLCPFGSDSIWFLLGECCSKVFQLLLQRCPVGICVVSYHKLWQPPPYVALTGTHDAMAFAPFIPEVQFSSSPSGLLFVWQSGLLFWCHIMVRGCGVFIPQPKASLMNNFLFWTIPTLSLILIHPWECLFNVSLYGLCWSTLVILQVPFAISFGPGTLSIAAKMGDSGPCFARKAQLLSGSSFWPGIGVLHNILVYYWKCIVNLLILDCIIILWLCDVRSWVVSLGMFLSSPVTIIAQKLVIRFLFMSLNIYLYSFRIVILTLFRLWFYFWTFVWKQTQVSAFQGSFCSVHFSLTILDDLLRSSNIFK